jgi:hypothetical protein
MHERRFRRHSLSEISAVVPTVMRKFMARSQACSSCGINHEPNSQARYTDDMNTGIGWRTYDRQKG